jgi:hypothetical protein
MNKNIIIVLIIILFKLNAFSQTHIITGKIKNPDYYTFDNVTICQGNKSINCNYIDKYGVFHIVIDPWLEKTLIIKCPELKTIIINSIDTIVYPLNIIMEKDPYYKEPDQTIRIREKNDFIFIMSIQTDIIFNDFSAFKTSLGSHNTDMLEKTGATINWELAGSYKKYFAGFNIGILYNTNSKDDSLNICLNSTHYGLQFGYCLIDSKRIWFTPEFALKWYKYRLTNSNNENQIPLNQYLTDRDLDIRFNQLTGFMGFKLGYKFYNKSDFVYNYWTAGIYGGYIFKINDYPWLYSRDNRLINNIKIGMENYNIGLFFSLNIF